MRNNNMENNFRNILYLTLLLGITMDYLIFCQANDRKVVLCYVSSWAVHRSGQGRFAFNLIEPGLCTHIIYESFGISPQNFSIISKDVFTDFSIQGNGKGQVAAAANLKLRDPSMKVLVSVGGWNEASHQFSPLSDSSTKRTQFINSVIQFLINNNFDGLDIHWQYPGARGGSPSDKSNFVILLKELSEKLHSQGFILTVQLSGKKYVIDKAYDLDSIGRYADFVSLSGYEYNGPWEGVTGINAPLRDSSDYNVEWSVNYFIDSGLPAAKLVLGIPTYGHLFEFEHAVNGPAYFRLPAKAAPEGPWTSQDGFLGYNEFCLNLTNDEGAWKLLWDEESSTPFSVKDGKYLFSYDNATSIERKLEFADSKGLGGVMVFSVDMDDFRGSCGPKFPLLQRISSYYQEKLTEDGDDANQYEDTIIPEEMRRFRHSDSVYVTSFLFGHY